MSSRLSRRIASALSDLVRRVEAVAGLVVDRGRDEQPDLVVVAQRLDAYSP